MGGGWASSGTGMEMERRKSIVCVGCRSREGCIRGAQEEGLSGEVGASLWLHARPRCVTLPANVFDCLLCIK